MALKQLRDLLREVNLEVVTARQGIGEVVQELPAIRDMARKVTTIFDELPIDALNISDIQQQLPSISGRITSISDDLLAVASNVTIIHSELPAIRDALQRLAVRFMLASMHLYLN